MHSKVRRENSNIHTEEAKGRLRRTLFSPFFCSIVASVGIFGGISALFSGLVCVILHSLVNGDTAFDTVGTILLISAIPMILLGSIFVDEIEKGK